jgi:hypothetical protein
MNIAELIYSYVLVRLLMGASLLFKWVAVRGRLRTVRAMMSPQSTPNRNYSSQAPASASMTTLALPFFHNCSRIDVEMRRVRTPGCYKAFASTSKYKSSLNAAPFTSCP